MANTNLTKAKNTKNDEFYTQFNDIQKEINAYLDYDENVFRDKTILLPCDDPEWSNFTKFFVANFDNFGLKKLISTSYAKDSKYKIYGQLDLFEDADFIKNSEKYDPDSNDFKGKIFTLERGDSRVDFNNIKWDYLEGDGDFRSEEVKKLRDEADFIITNPPFSLFNEFILWIMEGNKKFITIGNKNAVTYKEVFTLIKDNKIWLGKRNINEDMWLRVPNNCEYEKIDANGHRIKHIMACWFTNVDHGRRHLPLQLMTMADNIKFNKKLKGQPYPKYDNYHAIDVSYVDAIPSDYDGVMGVPITYLDKYCPEQFEIIGSDYQVKDGLLPELVNKDWNGKIDRGYINGKRMYSRILIRKRHEN